MYEHKGRGLVPRGTSLDLLFGGGIHRGLDEIVVTGNLDAANRYLMQDIQPIEETTTDGEDTRLELEALGKGLLLTFHTYTLPLIKKEYDIVSTEQEIILPISDNLYWLTRIDGGLKRRKGGLSSVLEYKTTANPQALVSEAEYNLQYLMESAALESSLGEYVGGCNLLGLSKGNKYRATQAEQANGMHGVRRYSPFTYAYWSGDPFISAQTEYSLKRRAGFTNRVPTWLYPGLDKWLSEDYLFSSNTVQFAKDQIFMPPAIPLDRQRFESVKRQVIALEEWIADGVEFINNKPEDTEILLDTYFPQNTRNCDNDGGYRKPCPFIPICHHGESYDSDLYQWREANHPAEEQVLIPREELE
jgi:hypothetical protein